MLVQHPLRAKAYEISYVSCKSTEGLLQFSGFIFKLLES